ncbi:hypothetical protein KM043_008875 [Ampulex compressa]|nr:hypothetical protein KM043_008875 [Ampulex compressa]
MAKCLFIVIVMVLAAYAQENAVRNLPASLHECYKDKYLLQKDNRYPHTLNTLIAILRKIENIEGLNMDLRSLSVALLHRFRQDGIERDPTVAKQEGVTPYAPNGVQFFRHAKTLQVIPGNAIRFPNNSITDIERCTLHFMLSSSIEIFQRGDEGTVCRFANSQYRNIRSIDVNESASTKTIYDDVETFSPNEIIVSGHKNVNNEGAVDPNSLYPEFPPNHPNTARVLALPPESKCPVENGIIKTAWGAVSGGPLLAGIAAGTQPDSILLSDLLSDISEKVAYPSGTSLSNKWMATLGGDLAEVALEQGPRENRVSVGVNGNWNSSAMPRWYFLSTNERLDFTTAEIRGDLDGLILANEVEKRYATTTSIRLSQILDMYYSRRGFFNVDTRACNRRTLFTSVAPNETMSAQAFSAALVLSEDLSTATLDASSIKTFAVQAVNALATYIPSTMNNDLTCTETDKLYDFNQLFVDLTIIFDTNWPFTTIQPILADLLDKMEISEFNSNFTILNGRDGMPLINSSNTILDFFKYNSSHYANVTTGFDLPKSLEVLRHFQTEKLNKEREQQLGGANANIILIIPYTSTINKNDNEYCVEKLKEMQRDNPDLTILILTHGAKDRWSELVRNPKTDLFSIGVGDSHEALQSLNNVISRIKQVPQRLINTQCGADFVSVGLSNSYESFVEPGGINFHRMSPNYFFTGDSSNAPTIKVQGFGSNTLIVLYQFHVEKQASFTSVNHFIFLLEQIIPPCLTTAQIYAADFHK